jgi:hypothetical protein
VDLAPIIVTVPHRLGKAEAIRRIKARIDEARTREAAEVKVAEENWDGDRLTFRIALLGLPVTGSIDVGDEQARAAVRLSWYQSHMVQPAEAFIREEGARLLST